MKYLQFEQGTSEWEAFRRTKIGASDIGTIMAGTLREQYDLYQHKVNGVKPFVTDAMMRGTLMEEEAILWLFGKRKKIERPVVQNEFCDWLIASLDAYHEPTEKLVEIKCPTVMPDHPEKYPRYERAWWQIQAQLFATGLPEAELLIYSPLQQMRKVILRDNEAICKLLEAGAAFYERIATKNPPPEPPKLSVREDEDAQKWANYFKEIDEKLKMLEEEKALMREEGIYLAGDQPFECNGVVVQKVPLKESIDWEAACKFHKIDASGFKKTPKTPFTWRVMSSQKASNSFS